MTDAVLNLVPNREHFVIALKFIKEWAETRGIYGNKLGMLGGINCAILVAKTCQWFPTATAAKIVKMFFAQFSEWPWPRAVTMSNSINHPSINPPSTLTTTPRSTSHPDHLHTQIYYYT